MKHFRLTCAAIAASLVALALSGCSDSSGTSPQPLVVQGRYALVAIAGQPLPVATIDLPGNKQTLVADTLTLETQVAMDRARFRVEYTGVDSTFDASASVPVRISNDTVFFLGTVPDTAVATRSGLTARFRLKPAHGCETTRCEYAYKRVP
jgi:hypothetical protein